MTALANFFTNQLSSDLKWREEELAILRKQLIQSSAGSAQEKTLLRANLAMIYAHYEGFCKFALEIYIDALEKLRLKRCELKWPIAAHSLAPLYKELSSESNQTTFFTKIFNELESFLNDEATYDRPSHIANLWPDLLSEWLSKFNLDTANILADKPLLESLVANRNQIAHGKRLTIKSRADLDQYAHAAMMAMHEVAIGIADALEKKTYRRHAEVRTIFNHAT
ncbi:MAE_28990/MAE_18760 family HEPN-like nuclease [Ralstonia sp. 1138]|uniref:MAE_28990/MAE_18760 family HEPN-like nuclease n=1 Tax=Ralstonia sp. 1138 TaxID=3156423 RepID=UPI0033928A12